jgi:hypothetical protein
MEAFMPDWRNVQSGASGQALQADRFPLWDAGAVLRGHGPYHLINTNLVLVDSDDRTRKRRGGDGFLLSPLYCGSNATGWQRTEDFMGNTMTLPTAMATSGAAANPNTGAGGVGLTRSTSVSLLMTLLNLGLGYWAPNPGDEANRKRERPRRPNHFYPGLYELSGYDEHHTFVQLSDGGHFENLGLYELVRRRCRLIVLCDGAADPKFGFDDWQRALALVREDFGATIRLSDGHDLADLIPARTCGYPSGAKLAERGHVLAEITYADRTKGAIVYLKTTLIDGLGLRVLGYKGAHPDFPDETTADQFFDDKQFEAYRELGYRIAQEMIGAIGLEAMIRKIA